jgi:hypothetical protein
MHEKLVIHFVFKGDTYTTRCNASITASRRYKMKITSMYSTITVDAFNVVEVTLDGKTRKVGLAVNIVREDDEITFTLTNNGDVSWMLLMP